MNAKTATDVMRRKAGSGRPAPEIGRMTPARAWKLAMPRAAQDTLGVQASFLRAEESRVVSGDLAALVPEHGLIAVLEGPQERFGIAVLDPSTMSGLIEAATTGRISPRAPVPREPTRTDAIIAADLIDALLEGFEAGLAEMDDAPNLAGYRYAAPLVDTRAIEMTLAEGPYSVFRLTVEMGGGVRQGEMLVAFPVAPRGAGGGKDVAAFQKALAENVMAAPTYLDASLFRFHLPISGISALAAGDVLRVPLSALAAVAVEAGGRAVAVARLGQQGGYRAIRIASLAGGMEELALDADFEEASSIPAPAALPPGDFGRGDTSGNGFPDPDSLPPLDVAGDSFDPLKRGLPDTTGLSALHDKEEGELPEIAGLPPLSG